MDMQKLYAILYLEINLVSVILIGIIRFKTSGISKMVAQRNFAMAIDAQILFFLSDTFCVMMQNGILPYSGTGVLVAKELYFFATTVMCFFWFVYFEYMQDAPFVKSRKRVWIASGLVWIMVLLLVGNLFTGILFYVDSAGSYHRGPLFAIQYLLSYVYVFVACFRALVGAFQKEKIAQRRLLISLALFPIGPAIAGILQFRYPQLPLACATLAISTLVMYLNWVDEMISIDPLTRLNNRKQLVYSFEQWKHGHEEDSNLYLLLIDANKFKGINDTYGHIEGDAALIRIADALRLGSKELNRRANIARYGGDEFVMLVWADNPEDITGLQKKIQEILTDLNRKAEAPYELTVSIGAAKASADISLKDLIVQADEQMYDAKARRR